MRLRNVKGSRETIAANEYVVQNETELKGRWRYKGKECRKPKKTWM